MFFLLGPVLLGGVVGHFGELVVETNKSTQKKNSFLKV